MYKVSPMHKINMHMHVKYEYAIMEIVRYMY